MNMETINFIIVPVILRVIIGNLVFNILSLKNDIKYRNEKRMLKNALTICSTLPPSPPACKKFFNHKDTPNSIPSDVTEVIVSDKDGEHYCYREASPKEGSWGWCNIDLDATDTSNLKEVESWGFCSKDCFLHKEGT